MRYFILQWIVRNQRIEKKIKEGKERKKEEESILEDFWKLDPKNEIGLKPVKRTE